MNFLFTVIIFVSLLFTACTGKSDDKNKNLLGSALLYLSSQKPVSSLNFNVVSGSTNVSCSGTIPGTIGGVSNSQLKDLRFYVHDVYLIGSNGTKTAFNITSDGAWQLAAGSNSYGSYPGVALLDFEDGTNGCSGGTSATNKSIRGTSATGSYVGVEFKIGVPFYLNHLDVSTGSAPMNISAMYWAWNSGYKFVKFEYANNSGTTNYFHLGSSTCSGNSSGPVNQCSLPNRTTISLSKSNFDATKDTITLDFSSLYSGADGTGTSLQICMPGNTTTACQPLLKNIGLDPTTGATSSSILQSAFSLK